MVCWICGEEANTGEHLIKASDIKLHFPDITQRNPAFVSTRTKLNIPIGSRKSKHLHSKALLCQDCNSIKTRKYDEAWSKLSSYLYINKLKIGNTNKFNLNSALKEVSNGAIFCHLYFVKLLGCAVLGETNDVALKLRFSRCLLEARQHPDVFLQFINSSEYCLGVSDLHVDRDPSNHLARAYWGYLCGNIWIRVCYIDPTAYQLEFPRGWNPHQHSTIIKLTPVKKGSILL